MALHKSWIVFVGTFFLGESVVLAASALAAQGSWSVVMVAIWAFLGTVISDTVWFRTARTGLDRWSSGAQAQRLEKAAARLERLAGEHPQRALLFVKFIYGARIASIGYMAIREIPTRTFVAFDAVGTAIWLAVMLPLGWFLGVGLDRLGTDLRKFEEAMLGIVLVAATVRGIKAWRTHRSA